MEDLLAVDPWASHQPHEVAEAVKCNPYEPVEESPQALRIASPWERPQEQGKPASFFGAYRWPQEKILLEELGDETHKLLGPHMATASLLAAAILQMPDGENTLRRFFRQIRHVLAEPSAVMYEAQSSAADAETSAALAAQDRAAAESRNAVAAHARAKAEADGQAAADMLRARLQEVRQQAAANKAAQSQERRQLRAELSRLAEHNWVSQHRHDQQMQMEEQAWKQSVEKGHEAVAIQNRQIAELNIDQTRISNEIAFAWKIYADHKGEISRLVDAVKLAEESKSRILEDIEQKLVDRLVCPKECLLLNPDELVAELSLPLEEYQRKQSKHPVAGTTSGVFKSPQTGIVKRWN